ncbi:MAG: TIM barrel protein, partial [Candidatus Omnitrophica bacterium]|nr:TIM barrel protein [Candidatus Omnitrophota bacterium]
MGLAVSTSWNAFRHTGALSIVSEIAALDFHAIELGFNLPFEVVEGMAGLVERNKIQVVSLHNFCPIPDDIPRERALPDCFSMASTSPEERARAVLQTKKTIDTAASVHAAAVVLHAGRVDIPDRTRELIEMYGRGLKDTDEFRAARRSVIGQRKEAGEPYLANALASIEELERYAAKKGVLLGVETRFYYREIPNFEEIGLILKRFAGSCVRYWHDTGHAQLMENLGFCRH